MPSLFFAFNYKYILEEYEIYKQNIKLVYILFIYKLENVYTHVIIYTKSHIMESLSWEFHIK